MSGSVAYQQLIEAGRRRPPCVAVILGSGLGGIEERLGNVHVVPFLEVPRLSGATVPGHKGCVVLGEWAGLPVLVFSGRLHRYEGHAWRSVTQPIQLAREFGVEALIVTNAAGGIREGLDPGTLMVLTGHLNCTGPFWWRERNDNAAALYDSQMRAALQQAARSLRFELLEGIYAQVTGPCYETRAEIRALDRLGADAVGMSTAREIEAGHALGMRCAAISCITNRAAGLSAGPIHHEEVLEVTRRVRERLGQLLDGFLRNWK